MLSTMLLPRRIAALQQAAFFFFLRAARAHADQYHSGTGQAQHKYWYPVYGDAPAVKCKIYSFCQDVFSTMAYLGV